MESTILELIGLYTISVLITLGLTRWYFVNTNEEDYSPALVTSFIPLVNIFISLIMLIILIYIYLELPCRVKKLEEKTKRREVRKR